ncbi:MAG: hypothetical protein P8Z36_06715, partial [Gemmatimonadota bacterium]
MPDGPYRTEGSGQEGDLKPGEEFAGLDLDLDVDLDVSTPPEALEAEEVGALLSTLSKTMRAFQLYKPNNPVLQR